MKGGAPRFHEEICTRGYNENWAAFLQSCTASDILDASFLLMPLTGFSPPVGSAASKAPQGHRKAT